MSKEVVSNLSVFACVASMVGILLSPSIAITCAITVVGGGLALIGLAKLKSM